MNAQRAKNEHLLLAWDENVELREELNRVKTALEVSIRDTDHLKAELQVATIRNDVLSQQNMEYRIQLEAGAKELEEEVEMLSSRRSKIAVKFRSIIRSAEMKPYVGEQLGFFREGVH